MFREVGDKDVRRSLRVGEVPLPELAPDEVLIAVMASAINYNTVWSATFEPAPTFQFLAALRRQGRWGARHDQPYHVIGSDAAGVVIRVGSGVLRWSVGDRVVVTPPYIDAQDPASQSDGMLGEHQLAWGFETNFGGLAHFAVARANQLLPKPGHLSWEEAACNTLCAGTAYRMLVGERGARLKQGDIVLVWGATGGLGSYAVQLVRNGGGIAIGVVSSEEKRKFLAELGCDVVINREPAWVQPRLQGRRRSSRRGVAPAGQRDPTTGWRGPAHRLRAHRAQHLRRLRLCRTAWWGGRDLRLDQRVHPRIRQPTPVDAAQADRRQPWSQLPGGLGGDPSHQPWPGSSRPVAGVRLGRRRGGGSPSAAELARREGRRALPCTQDRPRDRGLGVAAAARRTAPHTLPELGRRIPAHGVEGGAGGMAFPSVLSSGPTRPLAVIVAVAGRIATGTRTARRPRTGPPRWSSRRRGSRGRARWPWRSRGA